ncbi:O-succinylbenzoic acid--CoA ligase [Lutibacter agarilyticus]|uniref:O-succinylbenzoic acid--CoA ligase n=1 Tax=Lutibacter agarilyticus TaxID=1109740 RepID=A0A238X1C1_9FLAO|nr:AMP-binding protein [Lutibacter agarilyticus]SNR52440.1 O-succinylbenzoic acid--CoA ligase [Lutibacter agarilyticus]
MNESKPFHKAFKLQGKSFNSAEELIGFSLSISDEIHLFLKEWFNKKQFVEVKTSGSTGTPKKIKLQKSHMRQSAKATGDFFNLGEGTTALLCMSSTYIAGKMMLVRALELGWELDVVEPESNPLKGIKKNYDFCAMVPIQLYNSLDKIYKVKQLIVGGGIVSNDLLSKIQHCSTAIFATYGMTETVTHIAVKKLNNFKNVISSSNVISSAVEKSNKNENANVISNESKQSLYKLLPNISIKIDDRGCLVIKAPKLSNEEIITNDLVEIISDTAFKWLGRFDSVINSGGIKLIPEQIELKISSVIQPRFFVAGITDAVLGEKLVLIVEGEKEDTILNDVRSLKTLSKYEIPKEIFFVKKFKETPTQKINRIKTLKLISSTC